MNTLAYPYSEPFKIPAGVLALAVHGAFFALLYFGINWRTEPPQGMAVDIWDSLPAVKVEPVKIERSPIQKAEPPKPVPPILDKPVVPPKADIELVEKKKPKIKPPEPKQAAEVKKPPVPLKQTEPRISADERALQAAQAEQDRARAAEAAKAAAAITNEVGRYKGLISAKIRRNIVMPPDVANNIQAEFDVVLLPGGSVLSSKLAKPSGSAAYDEAVERAIMKAQPLPLPPDVSLFNRFRELHLTFTPKE